MWHLPAPVANWPLTTKCWHCPFTIDHRTLPRDHLWLPFGIWPWFFLTIGLLSKIKCQWAICNGSMGKRQMSKGTCLYASVSGYTSNGSGQMAHVAICPLTFDPTIQHWQLLLTIDNGPLLFKIHHWLFTIRSNAQLSRRQFVVCVHEDLVCHSVICTTVSSWRLEFVCIKSYCATMSHAPLSCLV